MSQVLMKDAKMNAEKVLLHATVIGRVQGVGFRATTKHLAQALQINGTVKNRLDGSVEIYAEGSKENLDKLIESLQKHFRDIDTINTEYLDVLGHYNDFRII